MSEIKFYRVNDPYGCFSNFAPYGFELDGFYWRTVEHYFQAQKFEDIDLQDKIRTTISPMEVALIGRDKSNPLRKDWEQIKDDVMRRAVLEKFKQNEELKKILLDTNDALLIEHTKNDSYWADGGDGTGKNKLGIILMEVRNIFSYSISVMDS